ncbi:sulfate permease [Glycocaulis profundi]|nr:sulfate permease [Glycocaulis profundi]
MKPKGAARYLPILDWGREYRGQTLASDLLAAVIVTLMLIPQSLAYAMLAGLPPQMGLYASIAPLLAYALFGTSRTLAVGPVAVISLMTAAAVGRVADAGTMGYATAAITLAFLSGAMLLAMGLLRMGFLANFLSHPVISGFITASGLVIAASQLGPLLGVPISGHTLIDVGRSLWAGAEAIHGPTAIIGAVSLVFLFWARKGLKPLLLKARLHPRLAELIARAGPALAVLAAIGIVTWLRLDEAGVRTVGAIPAGLPPFTLPSPDLELWSLLAGSALLISVIGFVESVSVAQTLAAKRRQRIDPDQELVGLGAANMAASFSGGYPVTGGFARSVVNFDAGAATPAAGAFTAAGILLAGLFLTPVLFNLPSAVLAATIIVAVLSLVDLSVLRRTFAYSKGDFSAMAATILVTLLIGVEAGVVAGVALSLLLHLYKTSRPHSAVMGQVAGTEHFRNVERHKVVVSPKILTLRVDESLYFANARFLEDRIYDLLVERPEVEHFILMCPAVNAIDASALESLEAINQRLKDMGVAFHLSEVKGPVMDRLRRAHFLDDLSGEVFLSQYEAVAKLDPGCAKAASAAPREETALAR